MPRWIAPLTAYLLLLLARPLHGFPADPIHPSPPDSSTVTGADSVAAPTSPDLVRVVGLLPPRARVRLLGQDGLEWRGRYVGTSDDSVFVAGGHRQRLGAPLRGIARLDRQGNAAVPGAVIGGVLGVFVGAALVQLSYLRFFGWCQCPVHPASVEHHDLLTFLLPVTVGAAGGAVLASGITTYAPRYSIQPAPPQHYSIQYPYRMVTRRVGARGADCWGVSLGGGAARVSTAAGGYLTRLTSMRLLRQAGSLGLGPEVTITPGVAGNPAAGRPPGVSLFEPQMTLTVRARRARGGMYGVAGAGVIFQRAIHAPAFDIGIGLESRPAGKEGLSIAAEGRWREAVSRVQLRRMFLLSASVRFSGG